MTRREPAVEIEGPDERGLFVARWRGLEGLRGEGGSPQDARAALFESLVESLRRGISEEERARIRAYRGLAPAERTRRAASLFDLSWSRD
jgi:hypothetical protein